MNALPTILHICPVWLPQTQTWMYSQVAELQHLGVDAHIVCERIENLEQFSLNNIHCLGRTGWFNDLWDRGVRYLGFRRHLNYTVKIGKVLRTNIVHSHFGHVGWANLGVVRKLGARHVVTFYGYDVNKLPTERSIWRNRYKQLFEEVDLILCEGSHMASCIAKLGCPEHKIKVQHLGVDIGKIEFKPRLRIGREPLRVLIAGSFREKKGIPYAIEALALLSDEIPLEITIIGDANHEAESQLEKQRILRALLDNNLKDRTRLLGYQPYEVLFQEAYRHHIFLQPSVTATNGDTEGGAPVIIIEMLASGMPVVSTLHCDIPEIMGSGLAQYLTPEGNSIALADCLKFLWNNTEGWAEIANCGRNRVSTEYNLKHQTLKMLEIYKEITI